MDGATLKWVVRQTLANSSDCGHGVEHRRHVSDFRADVAVPGRLPRQQVLRRECQAAEREGRHRPVDGPRQSRAT
eukprot:8529868-Pyramimonas_sp.AAC.1